MTAMNFAAVTTDRQIATVRELVADAAEHFVPMSASLRERFDRLEWLRTEVSVFARNTDAAEAEGHRLVVDAALDGKPGAVAKAARSAADAVTAAQREVAARGFAELAVPAVGKRLIASYRSEWPVWWINHVRPVVLAAYAAIDEVVRACRSTRATKCCASVAPRARTTSSCSMPSMSCSTHSRSVLGRSAPVCSIRP